MHVRFREGWSEKDFARSTSSAIYSTEPVTVISKCGMQSMPAFEAEIRWQQLGEKVRVLRQLELSFPATNQYAYERRGW